MRALNEEQLQALKETSILEIDRYIDKSGKIPYSLQNIGVKTLFDLLNTSIEQLNVPKGFPLKKSIELRNNFEQLPEHIFNDIVFWSKKYVFPSKYDNKKSLFENVDLIFEELIAYIKGCEQRIEQIKNNIDKSRVQNLSYIFTAHFKDKIELKYIANKLNFKGGVERVRQLLKNEFLTPLFNGEEVSCFKNITINAEIINQKKYCIFNWCATQPSLFTLHALGIDYVELRDNLGYIIVPNGEKGVYEYVYDSVVEKLIDNSIKPIENEELFDTVSSSKKIIKKVLEAGKVYDNEFINTLIYETDLINVTDDGIIIKPQYIKHASTGNIVLGKATARIVADAEGAITKTQIEDEYFNRYGIKAKVNNNQLSEAGCQAMGRTHWVYRADTLPHKRDWVNEYAAEKIIFYYNDIYDAITKAGYVIAETTLRAYITTSCQVNNNDKNLFCHKEYVANYPEYSWRASSRHGIINWLAMALKALFDKEQKDELKIKDVNKWLFNYGKGSEYEEKNVYGYATFFYSSSLTSENGPFTIKGSENGDWYLKKNNAVYDSINWANVGRRGRSYEAKLLAVVTNIVRKTEFLRISLIELVDKIYEEEYFENLDRKQIRQKILRTIEYTYIPHALKIKNFDTGREKIHIVIDARKIVYAPQYMPTNKEVIIEYKSISQIAKIDWNVLRPILYKELLFCSEWLIDNKLCDYEVAFNKFENFIKRSRNKNLNTIVPQKLYEFFFVSDPTDNDQYLIMCLIAKNFEALLKDIYYSNTGIIQTQEGLYDLTEKCEFYIFNNILDNNIKIWELNNGSFEKSLKYLSKVRNTDAHGEWYIDTYKGDTRPESVKNIEKIRYFAALYIFAVAKYLN